MIGLAFHVDYWDSLGWQDRFASSAFTARQAQMQKRSGARYSYTPQVLIDGADYPAWRSLRLPMSPRAPSASAVKISIVRDGSSAYTADVIAAHEAPEWLEGFWAMTEDTFSTAVRAGENQGATLRHDLVVREYLPLARWPSDSRRQLTFKPHSAPDPAHRRLVDLVVVDAKTGRPVQALKVGC